MEWYLNYKDEFLVITGGYGIGKSKTIRQILSEKNIPHTVIDRRIEYEKDLLAYVDGLVSGSIIVFDDAFVSKRLEQTLFSLVDKNIRPVFIVNDIVELDNIKKVLGRVKRVNLNMKREDLKYLMDSLANEYNISYNDYIILNLRDLVNITVYELTKDINHYKPRLVIEEILEEIENIYDKKDLLKIIIQKIYEKRIVTDEEVLTDIAVKVLGYKRNTAKRYIRQILGEIW